MEKRKGRNLSVLIGAALLMAAPTFGPSFLTQSSIFIQQLGANYGFVILVVLIISVIVQITVWRVIGISGLKGSEIANRVLPGLGHAVTILVVCGGLIFNLGNVAGCALGLNVIFGLDLKAATVISIILAVSIFLSKEANKMIDKLTQVMVAGIILLITYVAISSHPPALEAVKRTFLPEKMPLLAILTLIGTTVGGYLPFAGGHRLLDGGIQGIDNLKKINKSVLLGLLVMTVMRVLFFLAVLGVVSKGISLNMDNPAADAFFHAAGTIGYKFFGVALFFSSTAAVVSATYTSMSFVGSLSHKAEHHRSKLSVAAILFSGIVFMIIGKPAELLVLVGALNGLILPITLFLMLWASRKKDIVGDYEHPKWLLCAGYIVLAIMMFVSIWSLFSIGTLF